MALEIDNLINYFANQRKNFERRWYDNNFFDDGFHFRYLSRSTGKIIDLQEKGNLIMPTRAIQKASRQIRGVANLLLLPDYKPVVYPEKVSASAYPPVSQPPMMPQDPSMQPPVGQSAAQPPMGGGDPTMGGQPMPQAPAQGQPMGQPPMPQQPQMTSQQVPNPAYQEAIKRAKETAKRTGSWIEKCWNDQELEEKLTLMVILAAKHGVSYLQIWPDAVKEDIRTQVFDAFDIYLKGSLNDIYDSPAIIKATPMHISEIRANEMFDEEAKQRLIPDNKYAQSLVKDAYMRSRFGQGMESDMAQTMILKEAFIKEYVGDMNRDQIFESLGDKAKDYKDGDPIIRQTFTAAGVTLKDGYLDLPEYPFIDFRMEPGPIYQVPLIERFIPANKSLDIIMSRMERYFNTMITGTWLVRKGENMQITNIPGGQQLEYTSTPPTQANMSNPQTAVFPFIGLLEKIIEEQGASTSALGQLPQGVKSGVAIESVKQTEFSNLKISSQQLKRTVKLITERLLDLASKFVEPKTVYKMDNGDPTYFDIIGEKGQEVYKKLGIDLGPDTVVIKKDYHVDIEVEQGMGLTPEGQKQTLQNLISFFVPLAQNGFIPPEGVKTVVAKLFELYGYGATQDLVDSMDNGAQNMSESQIMQMKVAIAEVLKDAQMAGQPAEQKAVMASKVGTLEALKESGMAEKIMGKNGNASKISESMSYKDAPPSIQRQMELQAGFEPATQQEHQVQQATQVTSLIPKNDNKGSATRKTGSSTQ
jgi:hypothetical protein